MKLHCVPCAIAPPFHIPIIQNFSVLEGNGGGANLHSSFFLHQSTHPSETAHSRHNPTLQGCSASEGDLPLNICLESQNHIAYFTLSAGDYIHTSPVIGLCLKTFNEGEPRVPLLYSLSSLLPCSINPGSIPAFKSHREVVIISYYHISAT